MQEVPDLIWYSHVSSEKKLLTRCPFATVEACPRYFQSLSLLAETGATAIPAAEDARLLKKWKSSDLWPRTAEQGTSVLRSDSTLSMVSNFCPEVTFERFGYFSTFLSAYSDGIASEAAHRMLARDKAEPNNPRWQWQVIAPQVEERSDSISLESGAPY